MDITTKKFPEKLTNVTDDQLLEYGEEYDITNVDKLYYMYILEKGCGFDKKLMKHLSRFSTTLCAIFTKATTRRAIEYWYDQILNIYNSDNMSMFLKCAMIDKNCHSCARHSYNFLNDALKHLVETTNVNIHDLNRLYDFGRFVYDEIYESEKYNISNIQYSMKWFKYVMSRDTRYDLLSTEYDINSITNDIAFMEEYVRYLDCPSTRKEAVRSRIATIKALIYDSNSDYGYNKTDTDMIDGSIERIIDYISSETNLTPYEYWKKFFPDNVNYSIDKELVNVHYPELYDALIKYVDGLSVVNDNKLRHEIINITNTLFSKFNNIHNASMFDYFMAGGSPDFKNTIEFIDKSGLADNHSAVRQLRGLINNLYKSCRGLYVTRKGIEQGNYIVRGYKLTDDDKQRILNYMERKGYPTHPVLFSDIAREYVYGNININD